MADFLNLQGKLEPLTLNEFQKILRYSITVPNSTFIGLEMNELRWQGILVPSLSLAFRVKKEPCLNEDNSY